MLHDKTTGLSSHVVKNQLVCDTPITGFDASNDKQY